MWAQEIHIYNDVLSMNMHKNFLSVLNEANLSQQDASVQDNTYYASQ